MKWEARWETRVFPNFNVLHSCPICGTSEDKECVLVAIKGTEEDRIAEAVAVHLDCLDPKNMWYKKPHASSPASPTAYAFIYIRAPYGTRRTE